MGATAYELQEIYGIEGQVSGAIVSGGIVSGAMVSGAIVSGAVVSGAIVSGAIVSGAIVSGAIVSGAIVSGAIVSGERERERSPPARPLPTLLFLSTTTTITSYDLSTLLPTLL